jgi:hypothetical protein
MNSKTIQIGSIVYGAAGVGCRVLAIDGDVLTIETPKGEGRSRAPASSGSKTNPLRWTI